MEMGWFGEKLRQSQKEGCYPLGLLPFDEKQIDISISESVFLTLKISPPSSSSYSLI
jgi:hypothetical protein